MIMKGLEDSESRILQIDRNPGVDAVEGTGRVGADFEGHAQAGALVVFQAGSDERELVGLGANVFGEHFFVTFEAAACEHDVGGVSRFLSLQGDKGIWTGKGKNYSSYRTPSDFLT